MLYYILFFYYINLLLENRLGFRKKYLKDTIKKRIMISNVELIKGNTLK